jgi:hypothetical protein
MSTPRSIVIAGSLAQKPGRGGHTWVFLQYVLGFLKLGWDVTFLDRLEPEMCTDDTGARVPIEASTNVRYFLDVMQRFGLEDRYGLLCDGGRQAIGLTRAQILRRVSASEAVINVMGFFTDEEILAAAPRRVFLDIDPGFGQMWQALGQYDTFRGHDAYVTIAENIGKPGCSIPDCGLEWVTTRQPVVIEEWPDAGEARGMDAAITSVASWRGAYGPVEHGGTTYTLRVHEFRKFAGLPRLASGRFELALDIHPADANDIELLTAYGWSLVDPRRVAGDPWTYRDYIRRSAAEVMIAKGMYVQTGSGWFSDRSICYLASGRPVLAQDTGFGDLLPVGDGLLTFTTIGEAAEAARAIDRDYAQHARAARRVALECFESSMVLGVLTRKLNLC